MTPYLCAAVALAVVVLALWWRVYGGEPTGQHSAYGRHRLDRQPLHAGYVHTAGPAAELTEVRGRHAA